MNFFGFCKQNKREFVVDLMNISIIVLLYETEHAGSLPFIDIHIRRLLKYSPWF